MLFCFATIWGKAKRERRKGGKTKTFRLEIMTIVINKHFEHYPLLFFAVETDGFCYACEVLLRGLFSRTLNFCDEMRAFCKQSEAVVFLCFEVMFFRLSLQTGQRNLYGNLLEFSRDERKSLITQGRIFYVNKNGNNLRVLSFSEDSGCFQHVFKA